ncbi:MAG: histidine phosphatase family protein [Verrucomicrobia bacterium]|nr:histidine phosphatase family protein [Verrucomicrobiota bacterium]
MKLKLSLRSPSLLLLALFLLLSTGCSLTHAGNSDSIPASSTIGNISTPHGKLIFAVDLIRHGDRNPLMEIPTAPHTWQGGLEELTKKGIDQEFALGKQLSNRYITQSNLLPDHYLPETMEARSTGLNRTIMSANSALMGLYFGTGPLSISGCPIIPTHNRPRTQEDLLFPDNDFNFNFHDLFQSVITSSQQWQEKEQSLKGNFERWSKATGVPITQLYDLKNLGDTLFIYQLNKIPMPPLLSKEDTTTIINAGLWATCFVFQNKTVGQAAAANLLQEINNSFQNATQPTQPLRYRLYCGHDSTLLVLMTALGATTPLTTIPPYASDLNLELFDEGNGTYTVQVTLNNQPVILNCSGKNTCTLDQLKSLSDSASAQLKKIQALQAQALETH